MGMSTVAKNPKNWKASQPISDHPNVSGISKRQL
jgi:hypothetical protein